MRNPGNYKGRNKVKNQQSNNYLNGLFLNNLKNIFHGVPKQYLHNKKCENPIYIYFIKLAVSLFKQASTACHGFILFFQLHASKAVSLKRRFQSNHNRSTFYGFHFSKNVVQGEFQNDPTHHCE